MKLLILLMLISCKQYVKDNNPMDPISAIPEHIQQKAKLYRELGQVAYDERGLYNHGGKIGDSALFSCLGMMARQTSFDVNLLFTQEGKPLRHPDIKPDISKTPISKDMVSGILWCLKVLDNPVALELIDKMINYGRANTFLANWNFCSEQDVKDYDINLKDSAGRCIMVPAIMKDTHRVAIKLGRDCDVKCKLAMQVGINIPNAPKGYKGHLAALTTTRNGLIEGAINDNSLKALKELSDREPNNGIYSAAYHRFTDGDQSWTWEILGNEKIFPSDRLASNTEYCTDYLFQRDEIRKETLIVTNGCVTWFDKNTKEPMKECGLTEGTSKVGVVYNDDWLPCPDKENHPKSMLEWLVAYTIASGEI